MFSECSENLIRFFLNISEFLVQIIPEGGAPGAHKTPGRASTPRRSLVGCGPHVGPLTYLFSHHCHLPPAKNHHSHHFRVLALKPVDFDLFARSSIFETIWRDCYLVCDSSIAPISFCFNGLFL